VQLYPKVASEKFTQEQRDELFQVNGRSHKRGDKGCMGIGGVQWWGVAVMGCDDGHGANGRGARSPRNQ
jgi:hypothetical protein